MNIGKYLNDFFTWLLENIQAISERFTEVLLLWLKYALAAILNGGAALIERFAPDISPVLAGLVSQHQGSVPVLVNYMAVSNDFFPWAVLVSDVYFFCTAGIIIVVIKWLWRIIP